jgi:hypothetical protein
VQENAPPQLLEQLRNPQFLLSSERLDAVREGFQGLGPNGGELFAQSIDAVRESLATAISEAFLIAGFVTLAAVFFGAFLKEVPLRKSHDIEGAPAPAAAAVEPAAPAPVPVSASEPAARTGFVAAALGALGGIVALLVRRDAA